MKSHVGGILERGGGCRIVVTEYTRFRYHVKRGERLFIVPDLHVDEPVPWEHIPWVIALTELHVARSIWPEPLRRWGHWPAELHWRTKILPELCLRLAA